MSMKENSKKPSIDDIARSLGVSKTLVSMVINNKTQKYGISEKTRKKVEEKIIEMGFMPNKAARRLRTGKSFLVGVIVPDISNPFYSKIVRIIEDKAQLDGYNLMICSSDEDSDKEINLIKMLVDSQQVDGLILSTTLKTAGELEFLRKRDFPCVLIDRSLPEANLPTVSVDNEQGAFLATETLIKSGCKHIALFTISPGYISTIEERKIGFTKALQQFKLNSDKKSIIEIPYNDIKNSVYENLDNLLKKGSKFDGLFAANNNIALACMEYFSEHKIKVPEKLKFVSFDDIDVFRFSSPTISAVEQPMEEIGSWSFKVLKELLENGHNHQNPAKILLPTRFIKRKSS
jgi:LacI family transcriptional regulator